MNLAGKLRTLTNLQTRRSWGGWQMKSTLNPTSKQPSRTLPPDSECGEMAPDPLPGPFQLLPPCPLAGLSRSDESERSERSATPGVATGPGEL